MDETTSIPQRLALPVRAHVILALFVAACGTYQQGSHVWVNTFSLESETGWPAVWHRATSERNWEQRLTYWRPAKRTVEWVPTAMLLNLTFFAGVWLLVALSAEMLAARRFSLAGLFSLMFLVALLLGLLLGARTLEEMEGEPLVMRERAPRQDHSKSSNRHFPRVAGSLNTSDMPGIVTS